MKEIKINIPEYDDAIELVWDDNYKIKTSTPYESNSRNKGRCCL